MSDPWPTGPVSPPAPLAEVHIWRADLEGTNWPPVDGLPAAERERAKRMRQPEIAKRWIASRWAIRTVLGRYLEEDPGGIGLRPGEHGKPELANDPERLRFNLSHSGALALVAVAIGREVGVDGEKIEPDRDLLVLAERGLEPAAAGAVRAAPVENRPAVFYREWVRHEARVKCFGSGLGSALPRGPVSLSILDVDQGYAAALATAGQKESAYRRYSL